MKLKKRITDHNHDKYITTPEFSKLTEEKFAARSAQTNLSTKSDVFNFVNKSNFTETINWKF